MYLQVFKSSSWPSNMDHRSFSDNAQQNLGCRGFPESTRLDDILQFISRNFSLFLFSQGWVSLTRRLRLPNRCFRRRQRDVSPTRTWKDVSGRFMFTSSLSEEEPRTTGCIHSDNSHHILYDVSARILHWSQAVVFFFFYEATAGQFIAACSMKCRWDYY